MSGSKAAVHEGVGIWTMSQMLESGLMTSASPTCGGGGAQREGVAVGGGTEGMARLSCSFRQGIPLCPSGAWDRCPGSSPLLFLPAPLSRDSGSISESDFTQLGPFVQTAKPFSL